MILPTEDDALVSCRVDAILSAESNDGARIALDELSRYLSKNPRPAVPGPPKVHCAIAVDSKNDCFVDIISSMLPRESQPSASIATDRFTDVIRIVRDHRPAVLFIHSNLVLSDVLVIVGCVAASPSTRCVVMTAWSDDVIDQLREFYESLQISVGILKLPFERKELIECSGLAPY